MRASTKMVPAIIPIMILVPATPAKEKKKKKEDD
jgi:hypothetical protein